MVLSACKGWAYHRPFIPLVRDGWSFIWDQSGAFLRKSDRVVKCEDSDLPTFDLDGTAFVLCRGERGMCQECRKVCVVHSDFTHLGPSKFCDTCRISKIREKPHCKVDKEAKEKTLEEIKKYRKEVGYLQKISIDTFGPAVKTYQEHVYGTLALDNKNKVLFVDFKRGNSDEETLDNFKSMFDKQDVERMISAHYDGGSEFKDKFETFLKEHHVHISNSSPETPEENSLIERQVGETKQGTRALLHKANHPTPMWDRAMAVWVANRNDELACAEKLGLKLHKKVTVWPTRYSQDTGNRSN